MRCLLALKWDMELTSGLCSPLCSPPRRFSDDKLPRNVIHCYHSLCNKHLSIIVNTCGSLAPLLRFLFWWKLPFSGEMNQVCPQVTKLSFIHWKKWKCFIHICCLGFLLFYMACHWPTLRYRPKYGSCFHLRLWRILSVAKVFTSPPKPLCTEDSFELFPCVPPRQIASQLPGEELHCAAWVGKGSRSSCKMHRWQQILWEQVRLCFHLCANVESWPCAGNICQRMS